MLTKFRIEICIISARSLSYFLMKPQWFAVCWIDQNSKQFLKLSPGNPNPTLKPKFIFYVDGCQSSNLQALSLTVEIHRIEPIFLRKKLHGAATIMFKEFFANFSGDNPDAFRAGLEEISSFQLRKQNSLKPRGFVDISIHITEETDC